MAIRMMCDKSTPGAELDTYWSNQSASGGREIYTVESHKGLVLSLREMNGRDDSDFYALVWDEATGTATEIMYASTRGWTYPNGASIDATPEVQAAYKALCDAEAAKAKARRAERDAQVPRKGSTVRFVKNIRPRAAEKPKADKGEVGEVFWFGQKTAFGSFPVNGYRARGIAMDRLARSMGFRDPRDGYRVGVALADGRKVFTDAINVEVTQ